MIVSVIPSARYSVSSSTVTFVNGRIARESMTFFRRPTRRAPDFGKVIVRVAPPAMSFNPASRSFAPEMRFAGSFSRQEAIIRSRSGGIMARSEERCGSFLRMATMVSAIVSSANGRRPWSISYNTMPSENRSCAHRPSARAPAGRHVMNGTHHESGFVSRGPVGSSVTTPVCGVLFQRTSPKSRIFTRLSDTMKIFSGFRSLWMIPREWAAANPSAIAMPISSTFSTGTGPSFIFARKSPFQQFHYGVYDSALRSNIEQSENSRVR